MIITPVENQLNYLRTLAGIYMFTLNIISEKRGILHSDVHNVEYLHTKKDGGMRKIKFDRPRCFWTKTNDETPRRVKYYRLADIFYLSPSYNRIHSGDR